MQLVSYIFIRNDEKICTKGKAVAGYDQEIDPASRLSVKGIKYPDEKGKYTI
ncbi:hypothetical protein [Methanomethylovorans sp.]|uniref:hypothetical protein n=1 Tax=Methanomethylovorans sp. TaxID=2758717 RepID=UPI002FDE7CD4